MHQEGMSHYRKALQLNPSDPRIHHDLGMALLHQRQFDQAVHHLSEALRRIPNGLDLQYTAVNMRYHLGQALFYAGKGDDAIHYLSEAIRLAPNYAEAHYTLAQALIAKGDIERTLQHYQLAAKLKPGVDKSPRFHYQLGRKFAEARRFHEAVVSTEKALYLTRASGDEEFIRTIQQDLERYKQLDNSPERTVNRR
jgi:tetratricopeptide (TPR) repeat protein